MKIYNYLRAGFFKPTSLQQQSIGNRGVDNNAIGHTIQQALDSTGLTTQANPQTRATNAIRQALSSAGMDLRSGALGYHEAIGGIARKFGRQHTGIDRTHFVPEPACPGTFTTCSYTNRAGTRAYKIYVPARYAEALSEHVPMVLMLHGCKQSPDDFATGTRMNALAEQHGFLVVYPAQAAGANGSKCWNWFRSEDQSRDQGEPSLIAGITRDVVANYRVDEGRIFVAGLSAGAAMAVILGATYPELYAAVGAHSGLPFGAAYDVPSAFSAMKGGTCRSSPQPFAASEIYPQRASKPVPTIVFHGDTDRTVHPANSVAIVQQSIRSVGEADLRFTDYKDSGYSRRVYTDSANRAVVEQWVLHGVGHAWSGGSPNGSFTDADSPDASAEMIRFFYSQQQEANVDIV